LELKKQKEIKSEGRKQLGRSKRRWEDNIRMDFKLKDAEWVDCIHLNYERQDCQAVMKMVLNFLVP
jgi:hypothetical protein